MLYDSKSNNWHEWWGNHTRRKDGSPSGTHLHQEWDPRNGIRTEAGARQLKTHPQQFQQSFKLTKLIKPIKSPLVRIGTIPSTQQQPQGARIQEKALACCGARSLNTNHFRVPNYEENWHGAWVWSKHNRNSEINTRDSLIPNGNGNRQKSSGNNSTQ